MTTIACPHCRAAVPIDTDETGRERSCPECTRTFVVPQSFADAETCSAWPPPPISAADLPTIPPPHPASSATQAVLPDGSIPPELVNHPRYRVLGLLGSGGMGAVYKAEHRLMKRTVALKVIKKNLVSNVATVERFHREVEAAARLHHPNIVASYDAEQTGDLHFLVMEYVEGKDLHKVLAERGPLPVAEACDYIRQAALGLQHAMESGMVHRDIKPHNLILTPDGRVKILDFGLASLTMETTQVDGTEAALADSPAAERLTLAGAIMGTPDFMAPEQAKDAHAADIRADIYSLGCTLYCLLTGEVPFPGGTYLDKIAAQWQGTPRPVSEFRNDVPKGLVRVLTQMMAKNSAERPQFPTEVAEALASPENRIVGRCPTGIMIGSIIFMIWGLLIASALGIVAVWVFLSSPWSMSLVATTFTFVFIAPFASIICISTGRQLLSGRAADTLRFSVAMYVASFFVATIGYLGPFRTYVHADMVYCSAMPLVLGASMMDINRKRYLAWVRGRTSQ